MTFPYTDPAMERYKKAQEVIGLVSRFGTAVRGLQGVQDFRGVARITDERAGPSVRFRIEARGLEAIATNYRGSSPKVEFQRGTEEDLDRVLGNALTMKQMILAAE